MPLKIDENTTEMEIDTTGGNFMEIIYYQIHQVIQKMNREFRGGFYSREIIKGTDETRLVYIPDTREEFCNSVLGLTAILRPRFDKKMIKDWKAHKEKEEKIVQEFLDASSVDEEVILGEAYYESTEDKIFLETYKNKKLQLYIQLFARLNMYLGRKNYFEIVGGVF